MGRVFSVSSERMRGALRSRPRNLLDIIACTLVGFSGTVTSDETKPPARSDYSLCTTVIIFTSKRRGA